ncbi:MAG: hypothetical protein AB7T38_11260 [Nitrospirales bacterium]
MPPYLVHEEAWKSFWPMLLIALFLSIGLTFLGEKNTPQRKDLFLVLLAFAMLGIVTGYLTGFSRTPAIGAVVPAVLSLMGGLVVFLIGKNVESRSMICWAIFVFSFTLLVGSGWGAVMRGVHDNELMRQKSNLDEFLKSEDYLKKQAFIESQVNEFRNNLGLPPLRDIGPNEDPKKK